MGAGKPGARWRRGRVVESWRQTIVPHTRRRLRRRVQRARGNRATGAREHAKRATNAGRGERNGARLQSPRILFGAGGRGNSGAPPKRDSAQTHITQIVFALPRALTNDGRRRWAVHSSNFVAPTSRLHFGQFLHFRSLPSGFSTLICPRKPITVTELLVIVIW